MTATQDNAAPDPQQIIAELQRKLDEARAELAARNSAYTERIAYQAAANDVLKVMSGSPGDPQPVFDLIVERARDLCGGYGATVYQFDGTLIHWRAATGVSDNPWARQALEAMYPMPPTREWPSGRAIIDRQIIHISDLETEPGLIPTMRGLTVKSAVLVPLMRGGLPLGVVALGSRERGGFTDTQIELLKTFAEQAVIAITSAETYRELQQRTDDLREALQRQTATADVLKVISRSAFDLQAVLDTLVESAGKLCNATMTDIWLRDGDVLRSQAQLGLSEAFSEFLRTHPTTRDRGKFVGRAFLTGQLVHLPDVLADPEYTFVESPKIGQFRSALGVPMIRHGEVEGVFALAKPEPGGFADREIELVRTFADQALIAIENVRLFDEVQARTRDLQESLQQQTATADVLKVISRSTFDLRKVLETLVESAARLCDAEKANIFQRDGNSFRLSANYGFSTDLEEYLKQHPLPQGRGTITGRAFLEGRTIHIPDVLADAEYTALNYQSLGDWRSCLGVPLLRDGETLGVFFLTRSDVRPFTEKQIQLVSTFADQAVIAIENARLFEELRERQAELRVTFDNMGDGVVMFGADKKLAAWNRNLQEMLDLPASLLLDRPSFADLFRYLAERGEFGSADLEAELSRSLEDTSREMRYERTRPDGRVIEVRRNPVPDGGFVLIYADITERKRAEEAIRLARDAAEQALRDLRTAQDRLIQTEKLASLGQLTGIAHEIKNPLNFVNNFAALSAELTDELQDMLAPAPLADKTRTEIDELTGLLKDNLEKVVQHGRRADSIVKNMLLHSREGSGERRHVDINAIVEESLNLAYHGARAEKAGFDIAFERNFDPAVGTADVYPQEITRVLLNLISNGFYATANRNMEAGDRFEPRLCAATKNLGDKVEIRIRDNGTGIPIEIREKIFNPFFTTKPAGEGTGLGLSMSHDIIVKQHGGTIDVETQLGQFTEFRIILPRTSPR